MKKFGLLLGLLFAVVAHSAQAADATVSGTITRSTNGTAVESLLVYVENTTDGTSDYDYTDAAGAYSITISDAGSGTAGTYTVYNSYYTYADTSAAYIKQTQTVTLTDGQNKSGVDFIVDQQGKMTGHVYSSDGITPVYNSSISASRSTAGISLDGYDTTAASGYYATSPYNYGRQDISNEGSFLVNATAPGYFGASQTISTVKNTTTNTDFTLTPGSFVTGNITDTLGTAIAGATATLSEVGTDNSYTAITDSVGNYSISIYDVSDYGGTAVGYYSLATSATNYVPQSQSVHITADESTISGKDFSLSASGSITGTIYMPNGITALASATVEADDGYGNTYSTTSAADGTYTLNGLRTSTNYTITVSKDSYVTQKIYHVTVAASAITSGQDASLATAVVFAGTILTKGSTQGIEGATVYLYDLAKDRTGYPNYYYDYKTTSYTDGSFIIPNMAPGNYRIRIVKDGYITQRKIKIDLTNSVSGKNYHLKTATSIFGKITHQQQPVSNALVTVYSEQDSDVGYSSASSDAAGFYTIPNLKAGTYTLRITSSGYADKTITRKINKTTTHVNINLQSSGSASGFVYDAATQLPISGFQIKVRNENVSTYSDGNGYYVLDGLAPGKYTLYIVSLEYKTVEVKDVTITANHETKNANFNLQEK